MMKQGGQKGFTLIETIVAIIVAALLGLMIFMFAKAGVENAPTPWLRIVAMADLRQVMEDINEDYFRYQNATQWQANTLYAVGDRIRSTDNASAYECVTAGTSGAAEPAWPVVTDNGVVWLQYTDYLIAMQGKVTNKEYGHIDYTILENQFVVESGGQFTNVTPPGTSDYLKVSLGYVSGAPGDTGNVYQRVLTLFSKLY